MAVGSVGSVDYSAPTTGDVWMAGLGGQAAQMNAGRGGGGGSAGGGAGLPGLGQGGYVQKSFENQYDNPSLDLQKQQLAMSGAHWNQAFGALQGLLGRNQNPYTIGGATPKGPTINAGPVFNPQQIDQQVNSSKANSDAGAATQMRQNQASTTGRGFGSNSPLLAALNTSTQNANAAGKANAELGFREQAATDNAGQQLKGQQAQEQQFASRQQESIQRAAPYFQQTNALIAALAGLA